MRRTASDVHFGVAAAMEAAARRRARRSTSRSRVGVVIGSVMGGLSYTLRQQAILEERGWERVSPHWLPNTLVDTTTSHVATMLGARGLNYATESACATGTHAIGEAAAAIARDQADVILAGATESAMLPIILAGFCAMRALVDGRDDPAAASRPFDLTRAGFVMAEGAGVVVLEELERARSRGARIYCELVGYGASNDAYHVATPHPESIGVIEMMRDALEPLAACSRPRSTTSTPTAPRRRTTTRPRRRRSRRCSASTPTAWRSRPTSRCSGTCSARPAPSRRSRRPSRSTTA